MLSNEDQDLRGTLTRRIAELGHAPTNEELARRQGWSLEATEASLLRLHEAHALLLHPGSTRPWVVHPFALSPSLCWVATAERGYSTPRASSRFQASARRAAEGEFGFMGSGSGSSAACTGLWC